MEGTGSGGTAEGDTLISIEGIIGTEFNDKITAGIAYGFGGDDFLQGGTLYGGDGNDELYGTSFIQGGAGADIIDGSSGITTADYSTSNVGVNINLFEGTAFGGHADGDVLTSIEWLNGSQHDDFLIGGNRILGGDGDDYIVGTSYVSDHQAWHVGYFDGGIGDDTIVLYGDEEFFMGGDSIIGGLGNDTVDFLNLDRGIQAGIDDNGNGGFDSVIGGMYPGYLESIENISGSNHDDSIEGNNLANILNGRDGNDYLSGRDGEDEIHGGDGTDWIYGGADNDILVGGDGNDEIGGNDGDDLLDGGTGNDYLTGGSGSDIAVYQGNVNKGQTTNFKFRKKRGLSPINAVISMEPASMRRWESGMSIPYMIKK